MIELGTGTDLNVTSFSLRQSVQDRRTNFGDVFCLQTNRHGNVERIRCEFVLVNECQSDFDDVSCLQINGLSRVERIRCEFVLMNECKPDFSDVFCLKTNGHGSVERIRCEFVLVKKRRSDFDRVQISVGHWGKGVCLRTCERAR